jgi:hypothetical protein
VRLALLRNGSPSGLFFYRSGVSSFWFVYLNITWTVVIDIMHI